MGNKEQGFGNVMFNFSFLVAFSKHTNGSLYIVSYGHISRWSSSQKQVWLMSVRLVRIHLKEWIRGKFFITLYTIL